MINNESEPEVEEVPTILSGMITSNEDTLRVVSKFAKSAFKQEKLKSIGKPVYSGVAVFLIFLVGGCVSAACCGYMAFLTQFYPDKNIDYTYCKNAAGEKCADIIKDKAYIRDGDLRPLCQCELKFRIHEDINGPVGVYIHITNFFQNHRMYIQSIDKNQLKGRIYNEKLKKPNPPNEHCKFFDKTTEIIKDGKTVFPSGAVAYSWFSDQFKLYDESKNTEIILKNKGIVFRKADLTLFQMPGGYKNSDYSARPPWLEHFKKPARWRNQTFVDWWNDGGLENEAFINWMRVSSHSYTSKLFRTVDVPSTICTNNNLCKGNYTLIINYDFEVTSFKGSKTISFGTVRHHGTKNPFLVYIFGLFAVVAFILGPIMLFSLPKRIVILQESDDGFDGN